MDKCAFVIMAYTVNSLKGSVVSPVFDLNTDLCGIFIDNRYKESFNVKAIHNNDLVLHEDIKYMIWKYLPISNINSLKSLVIIINNELIHTYDFENDNNLKTYALQQKSIIRFK